MIKWWFKKDSDLLRQVCHELENDGNFEITELERNNLLIASGNIVLRTSEVSRFPILIVFPHTYPFSLPNVFCTKALLSNEDVINLSFKEPEEIGHYLTSEDLFKLYHERHQGRDSSLCLLERDNLEQDGLEFYSVNEIISRVRHWFLGVNTGNFPPEGPEIALFYHYPYQDNERYFIASSPFFETTSAQGVFLFSLLHRGYLSEAINESHKAYIGTVIQGKDSLIIHGPEYFEPFKDTLQFLSEFHGVLEDHETIQKGIGEKTMVFGHWWRLKIPLKPFGNIDALAEQLGDPCDDGLEELMNKIGTQINRGLDEVFVGFIYPDNSGSHSEWQFFVFKKEGPVSGLVGGIEPNNFKEQIQNYSIQAIQTEPLTDEFFYLRNNGRSQRDLLRNESVTVIGCGSLGSEIADSIGKSGIGNITLIDNEPLKVHNIVRHVGGLSDVDIPKSFVLAQNIFQHSFGINVVPKVDDILRTELSNYFDGVGISTIADDNIEMFLNQEAIVQGKTGFYARALRGGKAARIFRVIPGKDACFECLALYKRDEKSEFIDIPEDDQLPTLRNECNNPVRPGSAADLKIIAGMASRLVIEFLQGDSDENNHWVLQSNESGRPFDFAYKLSKQVFKPHVSCKVCNSKTRFDVLLPSSCKKEMLAFIRNKHPLETGGILIGRETKDSKVDVVAITGPGPNAKHKHNRFEKDIDFCQNGLDSWIRKDNSLKYIGEWHCHPSKDNSPSRMDLDSLTKIALQPNYLTSNPIMFIFNNEGEINCTVHPMIGKYYEAKLTIT